MKTVLMTALLLLAACGPYDSADAAQMASATEAQRLKQVDPAGQYRQAPGMDLSNRGAGADFASKTDYYYDPATGYCFATLLDGHHSGMATVDCHAVKHMLLNPPAE